MRRLLRFPIQYGYLQNFKKPVIEAPTTTPPKYIYEVKYHPSALPDLQMGFPDHAHMNDWYMIVYGEEDKYEFQYSGQWWEAVTVPARLILLAVIVTFSAMYIKGAEDRDKKHLPGFKSWYHVGEVAQPHVPTIIQN